LHNLRKIFDPLSLGINYDKKKIFGDQMMNIYLQNSFDTLQCVNSLLFDLFGLNGPYSRFMVDENSKTKPKLINVNKMGWFENFKIIPLHGLNMYAKSLDMKKFNDFIKSTDRDLYEDFYDIYTYSEHKRKTIGLVNPYNKMREYTIPRTFKIDSIAPNFYTIGFYLISHMIKGFSIPETIVSTKPYMWSIQKTYYETVNNITPFTEYASTDMSDPKSYLTFYDVLTNNIFIDSAHIILGNIQSLMWAIKNSKNEDYFRCSIMVDYSDYLLISIIDKTNDPDKYMSVTTIHLDKLTNTGSVLYSYSDLPETFKNGLNEIIMKIMSNDILDILFIYLMEISKKKRESVKIICDWKKDTDLIYDDRVRELLKDTKWIVGLINIIGDCGFDTGIFLEFVVSKLIFAEVNIKEKFRINTEYNKISLLDENYIPKYRFTANK